MNYIWDYDSKLCGTCCSEWQSVPLPLPHLLPCHKEKLLEPGGQSIPPLRCFWFNFELLFITYAVAEWNDRASIAVKFWRFTKLSNYVYTW